MKDVFHLAVWIDHRIAQIYRVERERSAEIAVVHADSRSNSHVHHQAGTPESGHEPISDDFLRRVSDQLTGAHEILVMGPAQAKTALKSYLDKRAPLVAAKIVGMKAMPSASAADILEAAGPIFRRVDSMVGGTGG